jgi:hypothetical protein
LISQTNSTNDSEDESDDGTAAKEDLLKDIPAALGIGLKNPRLDNETASSGIKKGRKSKANLKTVK